MQSPPTPSPFAAGAGAERGGEKLARVLKNLVDIPSLPAPVQRLIQLSDKDATPRQFADLIGTDQGLTAKVLRLVNSAFYSLRTPIASLRHASSLLGTRTLKSLALSVSVMSLFNRGCPGCDPIAFWRHAIGVAMASQKLAALLLPAFEEDLYVAGLLHDAGVALMVQHLPDEYSKVLEVARAEHRALVVVERERLGASHAEVGYLMAARWKLPPTICECIRLHEDGAGPDAAGATAPEIERAVDLVRFADGWAELAGLGFLAGEAPREAVMPPLPAWSAVDAEELKPVLEGLAREVLEREQVFFPRPEAARR
jgi:HD-like signal output (HDOD) protein